MHRFTFRHYDQTSIIKSRDAHQLASRLYTRTSWTMVECRRLADQLYRGLVVMAPDFETMILPGVFSVLVDRPEERANWGLDGGGAPPLLTGGCK